ncbi:MAG TPA: hypothetical protein VLX09_22555 [Stellaceae bacterium]|nr:hypothetical protein [Stellaceae bacterium]
MFMRRIMITVAAAGALATSISGCSSPQLTASGDLPDSCRINATAVGVGVGAAVGGGLGAGLSHGNAGVAVGAAALGAVIGGAIGHQQDENCRQLAEQRAIQMAAAQQAAAAAAAAQAHSKKPPQVAYQSVQYTSPSDGQRHQITPLNSYTDPATKETCSNFSAVTIGADGKPTLGATTGRACTGADGQVHDS